MACYTDEADIEKPLLAIFSIDDIEPGVEICFNYRGGESDVSIQFFVLQLFSLFLIPNCMSKSTDLLG